MDRGLNWKKFHLSYEDHMRQLAVVEDMFREAAAFMEMGRYRGENIVGMGNNISCGDFRVSLVFKDLRSLDGYVSDRGKMPVVGDYLMLFEAGREIRLDDPIVTIPRISRLAESQKMEATLPKITEKGLLEVSMYDEGQRLAVLWTDSYCTNDPDLALRIGKQIYGMQMRL